ncbi:delta-1-pyrroline-5-carboxylate synthase-like isoform X1 [Tachypleus tridentatus]|uniref:delta-1-pyrroline-5-carboxylate synthase-like isoform X1 n=1 Tax=Tachypleus tridentatus TaxID=6853 RepID=UPI003FD04E9F
MTSSIKNVLISDVRVSLGYKTKLVMETHGVHLPFNPCKQHKKMIKLRMLSRHILARPKVEMTFHLLNRAGLRFVQGGKKGLTSIRENISRDLLTHPTRNAYLYRRQLQDAKRIVVKVGSTVIARNDQSGLALGRLASIIEQVSQLQNQGKEMLIVTSGAVALGKKKLRAEARMSMSMRETLSPKDHLSLDLDSRTAAAVGQSRLMALYDAMFSQYGANVAQVLVTEPDFYNTECRFNMKCTVLELLGLNIIPIINANDTIAPLDINKELTEAEVARELKLKPGDSIITVKDNDSLAAHVAAECGADVLIMMSSVDGIFNLPPQEDGARLLHTYCPGAVGNIIYGEKSELGLGGMNAKVKAASWALDRGVSVIICNGMLENAILEIVQGKRVGTFFTNHKSSSTPVEVMAVNARKGSRILQSLTPEQRSEAINKIAELLQSRKEEILQANSRDIKRAEEEDLNSHLAAKLALNHVKLNSMSDGLRQIAQSSKKILGKVLTRTLIAQGIELKQISVPIGVLLVIFDSYPNFLPQMAALAISTGNGILLKGSKEAAESNKCLVQIIMEALSPYNATDAVSLVSEKEDIAELLQLEEYIDLVIPRGSSQLVHSIHQQSCHIPVLSHAEGVCHVYVDKKADFTKAVKVIRDSKCEYPAASNSMETLLVHKDLVTQKFFEEVCQTLKNEGVKIYSGPRIFNLLTFGPPLAKSMKTEHGGLACTVEVVDSVQDAIEHVNTYGSGHTDVIITEDEEAAETFIQQVESVWTLTNCSTRFSDGYGFGFGADMGISIAQLHGSGFVGLQGLLRSKWILEGSGNTVSDFTEGGSMMYHHYPLSTETENVNILCDASNDSGSDEPMK